MAMLGMKLKDHPDTAQVAREVLNQLRLCDIASLINEVNKGLPISVMNSLLYNPVHGKKDFNPKIKPDFFHVKIQGDKAVIYVFTIKIKRYI